MVLIAWMWIWFDKTVNWIEYQTNFQAALVMLLLPTIRHFWLLLHRAFGPENGNKVGKSAGDFNKFINQGLSPLGMQYM